MDNRRDESNHSTHDGSALCRSGEQACTKAELIARLDEWAARVLQDEAPPKGVAAEILNQVLQESETGDDSGNKTDAYGLWSAMTALTQEIKLQGRAFKQLHDTLAAQVEPDRPSGDNRDDILVLLRQLADHFNAEKNGREREIRMEAERKTRKELLEVLLDLRDRLIRGNRHDAGSDPLAPSWLDRLLGRAKHLEQLAESHRARRTGYRMSLERLEDVLLQYGVREIPCEGRLFDPRTMNVIDLEETEDHPDGRVLEVYQTGYEWNGQVLRTAQVKVARHQSASADDQTRETNGEPEAL